MAKSRSSKPAAPRKARVPRAAAPRATASATNDEGESQSRWLNPSVGGSYERLADGSLRLIHGPTAPADLVADQPEATKPRAKRGAKAGKRAAAAAVENNPADSTQPSPADAAPVKE